MTAGPPPRHGPNWRGWAVAAVAVAVLILLLVLWGMRPGRQGQPGQPGQSVNRTEAAAFVIAPTPQPGWTGF